MAKVSTRAYVSPYSNHPMDAIVTGDEHTAPSGVPSMATFIVGIFVAIIIGATASFAYIVYADDRGRTVRRRRLMTVRHVNSEEFFR